ncbi:MAG: carbamoyl phosphate synthase small subunit [Synergistaceae bacterium]|jgi:carbamoyl-phosphate synthase small subunit|nr:carbamoyl phosphate synthase small subunit [Synergistaceae bacterium]
MQPAYLILENSAVFEGRAFGRPVPSGGVVGEVVFTTGMTGYLETLTDPSYYGQIIVQTFPMIGNYGVIRSDFESPNVQPRGYIVREWCEHPSNFRSEGDLDSLLNEAGIPGLCGVDTRAVTRMIRERGVMNGAITSDPSKVRMDRVKEYVIKDSVRSVSAPHPEVIPASGGTVYRVVLWDFGAKANIARSLASRGCEVTAVPSVYTADRIASLEPDGVMLCNGPGDPADNPEIIGEIKKLTETGIPIFGICLGHQLLALAAGAKTGRLKYGHRGANQPVRDVKTGSLYITTQNHGYMVIPESIPDGAAELRYINANDGTCEGMDYRNIPAFSVQFHPEAAAGPLDTGFLFDRFTGMMEARGHAQK